MQKLIPAFLVTFLIFLASSARGQTGGAGMAVSLDGSDDYISVDHSPAFNVSAFTIEMWFQWGRSGNAVDFLSSKALALLEIHLGGIGPNAIRFIPTPGVTVDTGPNVFTSGQWTHLACVYDPANAIGKIYLNGVEQ